MRARLALWMAGMFLVLAGHEPQAQQGGPSIAGDWVGVFQSYPHFVRMDLRVPPPGQDGTMEAELRLEALVQQRTVGRAPTGLVKVSVTYDPAARTLLLTPAADSYRVLGLRLAPFSGVMDVKTQLIGGVLVGASPSASPYFVLGRSDVAESAFLGRLRAAITPPGASSRPVRSPLSDLTRLGGNARSLLGGGGPSPEKIREWAGRFVSEYPELDPYRTEQGKVFTMARNLFRDEHFEPFFGKRYDELSHSDLQGITATINKIPRPRANFPEERANSAVHAVSRGFAPMIGTYASPDITLSVLALRPIQAWRTQSLRLLESAGVTADALKVIAAIGRAEAEVLGTFWPSERKAFGEVVVASRGRVAGPALALHVDQLLAGATSFSAVPRIAEVLAMVSAGPPAAGAAGRTEATRGVRTRPTASGAAQADDSIPALLALVTPEARQTQKSRLESRLTELVADETGRDRDVLGRLGAGLDGLQAGGRWRAETEAKYRAVPSHPAVQGLFKDLADRRSPLLRGAEQTLATRIQAAGSTSDLNQLLGTYLNVPSDRSDPVGGRLLQTARTHGDRLRASETAIAAKQAEEKRQAASACASTSTDNGTDGLPGEPTERDMCRAVEHVLLGAQQNLKGMQDECRGLNSQSNPIAALTCLMGSASQVGGGPQMSLRGFRKIACSPAASAGRPGFFCDYVADLKTANAMTAPLINRMGGEISTARFVRSSGTWIFLPPR